MKDPVIGEHVALETLTPHPRNARRGNLNAITESLEANGQYQPIVVTVDGVILAGNHTWQAAKQLGWEDISVIRVDVDDDDAERIMLADNRTSDLSSYDDSGLLELLQDLGVLDGTAFTDADVNFLRDLVEVALDIELEPAPEPPAKDPEPEERDWDDDDGAGGEPGPTGTHLEVPGLPLLDLSDAEGSALAARFRNEGAPPEDVLRALLRFQPKGRFSANIGRIGTARREPMASEIESVAIDSIQPHPRNVRQGDVGAIASSLSEFGQYRPLVVSKSDNNILVGSHRWMAAKALGWDTIHVVYVDVDEEQELRLMLADNRTSDLGGYDEESLLALLTSVGSLDGTGYDLDDVDDLWARQATGRTGKTARVQLTIPHEKMIVAVKEPWRRYDEWFAGLMRQAQGVKETAADLILERLS